MYASRTPISCSSPQCGHSIVSLSAHVKARLFASVAMPVGTHSCVRGHIISSCCIGALPFAEWHSVYCRYGSARMEPESQYGFVRIKSSGRPRSHLFMPASQLSSQSLFLDAGSRCLERAACVHHRPSRLFRGQKRRPVGHEARLSSSVSSRSVLARRCSRDAPPWSPCKGKDPAEAGPSEPTEGCGPMKATALPLVDSSGGRKYDVESSPWTACAAARPPAYRFLGAFVE
jgi:hypothetical protein